MSDAPVTGEVVPPADVDDLDRAFLELAREPYVFQWAGQHWSLPHLGALDYRLQGEIESYENLGVKELEDLFRRLFGDEQADRWDQVKVPTPVLFMVFDRWVKHSGAKLGEEPASTVSSENTGGSSRPTSDVTTASASQRAVTDPIG